MNQPETGEAPEAAHNRSDSQKELAEVLRQRSAISAVLRAIDNSPHDLQPIFDTIIDSAVHLCSADGGSIRIVQEAGFRLVGYKQYPAVSEMFPPPILEHGSVIGRLYGSKSPVQIPDVAKEKAEDTVLEILLSKLGVRTHLLVPMLRNDELIGTLGLGRQRVEPFTENEIELVTDFAAQATIALEITRRENAILIFDPLNSPSGDVRTIAFASG
jgi:GAF domain-containing protein